MKTFNNLIEDVQKPGLCHRCGGCVTFCTAINYGALELDSEGKPVYADEAKCIECGLCHTICPEIDELNEETKKRLATGSVTLVFTDAAFFKPIRPPAWFLEVIPRKG